MEKEFIYKKGNKMNVFYRGLFYIKSQSLIKDLLNYLFLLN